MQFMTLPTPGAHLADTSPGMIVPSAELTSASPTNRESASFAEVLDHDMAQLSMDDEESGQEPMQEYQVEVQADTDVEAAVIDPETEPEPSLLREVSEPEPTDPVVASEAEILLQESDGLNPAPLFHEPQPESAGRVMPGSDMPSVPLAPSRDQLAENTRASLTGSPRQAEQPGQTEHRNQSVTKGQPEAPAHGRLTPASDTARPITEASRDVRATTDTLPAPAATIARTATRGEPAVSQTPGSGRGLDLAPGLAAPEQGTGTLSVSPAHPVAKQVIAGRTPDQANSVKSPSHANWLAPSEPAGNRPRSGPSLTPDSASVPVAHGRVDQHSSALLTAAPPKPADPAVPSSPADRARSRTAPNQAEGEVVVRPVMQHPVTSRTGYLPGFAGASHLLRAHLAPATVFATDPAGDDLLPVAELRLSSDPAAAVRFAASSAAFLRPETPRHVAAQIVEAIRHRGPGKMIDLTLNPAELGRVKISLQPAEGVMQVHIIADRGETLDLMRRHAESLAQEFHTLGFGEAQFAFSRQSSDHSSSDGRKDQPSPARCGLAGSDPDPQASSPSIGLSVSDRIDIRV